VGNILGPQQHGTWRRWALNMYCHLLNEAVASEREDCPGTDPHPALDWMPTFRAPISPMSRQKLDWTSVGQRGGACRTGGIGRGAQDRYGDPPAAVQSLLSGHVRSGPRTGLSEVTRKEPSDPAFNRGPHAGQEFVKG